MKLKLFVGIVVILLLSGCYTKESVIKLAEAENLHFTESGRLFVSSGVGFFELTKQNDKYQLDQLNDYDCGFAGITQIAQYVYTLCYGIESEEADKLLYVLDLDDPTRQLQPIQDLSEFGLPNGMTSDGEKSLYIANSDYFGSSGSIIKVTLGNDLVTAKSVDSNWASKDHNVFYPNGIKWMNNELWFTDLGQIKRISTDENNLPRVAYSFINRVTVFDDLALHCNGVLVTDFVAGQLMFIDANGQVKYKTGLASFQGASSLLVGQPPLFESHQIVATERGILLEENSNIGNKISTANFDFNLNNCQ